MRMVYCKCDTLEDAINSSRAYRNKLIKIGLNPVKTSATCFECNGYKVQFLPKSKFDTPRDACVIGRAFMTIPYNRLLMNPNGCKLEECKLTILTKYIIEGVN